MDRPLKRPPRPAPPSAHDVARLAGVSQAAVSRAFTPGASIAKATRDKVMVAATQLGYRPNLLARSLIKGVSDLVGVVIGNTQNPFFLPVLEELSTRLTRAGKHSLVFTAEQGHDADFQIEDVLRYRVDALVLMSASLSYELAEKCSREGIPLIFFNRRPRWDLPMASVTGANEKGAGEIALHLLEQGYRRIGYMGGPTNSPTNNEREESFSRVLAGQGLQPAMRELGFLTREGGMAAARAMLNRPDRPDAIFCANDFMAIAAMEVARHEFGLEIGREIGIVGFDDMPDASWPSFSLTTYSQPVGPMIDRVMDIVLDLDARERFEKVIVEGALQKRDSTRRG